ncbi:MAG: EAL domain-containing protein [Vallitaleaceae bacterium]|nr:EAL domain-containing protein [Vallitaleaceae bacterium]
MDPINKQKEFAPSPMASAQGRDEMYLYSLKKMADRNSEKERITLTGLYGTAPFFYKGNECMRNHPDFLYALIRMDIYRFKTVNEFCGRTTGDELLRFIADCFRVYENETTVIGHLRADTFQLLTPYRTDEDLVRIVTEINQQIENFQMQCKILPAFGICKQEMGMDVSLLSDYANLALQTVKGKIFSSYAFYDERMRQTLLYEKKVENEILPALKEGQLEVYIQPKVDMRTQKIVGGEALLRWKHPIDGLISPGDFIPILEKSGYIIEVDYYVWERVVQYLRKQMDEQLPVVPISLNVSRLHTYQVDFEEHLFRLLSQYRINPDMIILELTESSFIENADLLFAKVHKLQEKGFIISMDDFGSGYSSLNMLKDEPIDEIKMDRIFLSDITTNKSRIIIKRIIDLLKELDMQVVAEGVETREQLEFLLECGCYLCQGYFLYRPMPAADFFRLIAE